MKYFKEQAEKEASYETRKMGENVPVAAPIREVTFDAANTAVDAAKTSDHIDAAASVDEADALHTVVAAVVHTSDHIDDAAVNESVV